MMGFLDFVSVAIDGKSVAVIATVDGVWPSP